MGKVVVGLSMSLDGFIAGPNDDVERLFEWYFNGDTDYMTPGGDLTFKVSPISAEVIRESFGAVGVVVTGRRTFDLTNGWNGRHTLNAPVVVVTHTVPREWVREHEGAPFTFVTDGVERAVAQAKQLAGEKNVAVGAASLAQQALRAGLIDEVHIDLVPVLLGSGVRLFDNLGEVPIQLEQTRVVEAPGVTHLDYRVVKAA